MLKETRCNRATLLLCLLLAGCRSSVVQSDPSVLVRVTSLGETWETGEVKSCMQQTFKSGIPVLLCSTEAGAEFLLTSAAIDQAHDQAARSALEGRFLQKTKEFRATVEKPPKDAALMWDCEKTQEGLRCEFPRPNDKPRRP